MKALFSDVHWGRVLLTGVLLVILDVILNTVLLLLATHMWSQRDQAQIAIQVSSWSSYILVILLTVGGAAWVARKEEREKSTQNTLGYITYCDRQQRME